MDQPRHRLGLVFVRLFGLVLPFVPWRRRLLRLRRRRRGRRGCVLLAAGRRLVFLLFLRVLITGNTVCVGGTVGCRLFLLHLAGCACAVKSLVGASKR